MDGTTNAISRYESAVDGKKLFPVPLAQFPLLAAQNGQSVRQQEAICHNLRFQGLAVHLESAQHGSAAIHKRLSLK